MCTRHMGDICNLIVGVCLKYGRQYGMNIENYATLWKIEELVQDYVNEHFIPDYLEPENWKNLFEQQQFFQLNQLFQ